MSYASLYNPNVMPQSASQVRTDVRNNAGGYVFQIDKWKRFERFLILGSDAPTYYQSAKALTCENGAVAIECWLDDPERTAQTIVDISRNGRAPRVSATLYALALGTISANLAARQRAYAAISHVCRTASHLFEFASYTMALGKGWGRGLKRAVAKWYENREPGALAYQMIKYRERKGVNHERLLRLSHPNMTEGGPKRWLYDWATAKDGESLPGPPSSLSLVSAHLAAMSCLHPYQLLAVLKEQPLPWESLPTWALTRAEVWKAMLPNMPLIAMIRNLGNMTRIGALKPMSPDVASIVAVLKNQDVIRAAQIHPFSILLALVTYRKGRGFRGKGSWEPIPAVIDALNAAFYLAFKNVVPTGKRIMLALDVSGSMTTKIANSPLTCREATAALALVTAAVEPNHHIVGFARELVPLPFSPHQRLDDVVQIIENVAFGATDCALPMLYALEKNMEFDAFVVLTDNETWYGDIHPMQALAAYRRKTGIPAKLIVVGMTSTGLSIADPNDDGCLDLVGFDSDGPSIISDFIAH